MKSVSRNKICCTETKRAPLRLLRNRVDELYFTFKVLQIHLKLVNQFSRSSKIHMHMQIMYEVHDDIPRKHL